MIAEGFTTCLWFDDQAEEAAQFYTSIFPNSKLGRVDRYTEAGPREPGSVLAVAFELNGQKFVAINGGPDFTFNAAISFQILCDTQQEIDEYWAKLTAGGREVQCGWLEDRYGVSWQVIPKVLSDMIADPDSEKANRAMQAMLQMVKLDIAALEAAYEGSEVGTRA